jgi:hypothetical protein
MEGKPAMHETPEVRLLDRFLRPIHPRPARADSPGLVPALTLAVALVLLLSPAGANAATAPTTVTRTQTISLRTGWNSVYLEVEPPTSRPAEVFRGLPVETVASFLPGSVEERYLRQPGDAPWKEEGWRTWHAPHKTESFLSNLHAIQAHRPYLIEVTREVVWQITGTPSARPISWEPNSCTYTGLPVDPENPPTFATFFAGSPAHAQLRVFRLEEGLWKRVRNPAQDRIRSGEAYWIQTDGASMFQGPLGIQLPSTGTLEFNPARPQASLLLRNDSPRPLRVRVDQYPGTDPLPLLRRERDRVKQSTQRLPWPDRLDLPSLEPRGVASLQFEPDRQGASTVSGSTLLRISNDQGSCLWIPVFLRSVDAGSRNSR